MIWSTSTEIQCIQPLRIVFWILVQSDNRTAAIKDSISQDNYLYSTLLFALLVGK